MGFQNETNMIGNQFRASVWHIVFKSKTKTDSCATGFLFEVKTGPALTLSKIFLVSNEHSFLQEKNRKNSRLEDELWFSRPNDPSTIEKVMDLSPSLLHRHPNVDLAMIDVTDKCDNLKKASVKVQPLTPDMLLTFTEWNTGVQGDKCEFRGYPGWRTRSETFRGTLQQDARENDETGLPRIEINDTTVAVGVSGSPAFVKVNNRIKLIGIVEEARTIEITEGSEKWNYGWLVKSTALVELLNRALGQGNWR